MSSLILLIIFARRQSCIPFLELSFQPQVRKSDDNKVQPFHLATKSLKRKSKKDIKSADELPFPVIESSKPNNPTWITPKINFEVKPVKVKTKNSLTYRNVNSNIISMLRTRLNMKLPAWNVDVEKKILPPVNKTLSNSCTFLSGSVGQRTGICTIYGACRLKDIEFTNHVSITHSQLFNWT